MGGLGCLPPKLRYGLPFRCFYFFLAFFCLFFQFGPVLPPKNEFHFFCVTDLSRREFNFWLIFGNVTSDVTSDVTTGAKNVTTKVTIEITNQVTTKVTTEVTTDVTSDVTSGVPLLGTPFVQNLELRNRLILLSFINPQLINLLFVQKKHQSVLTNVF